MTKLGWRNMKFDGGINMDGNNFESTYFVVAWPPCINKLAAFTG